jgi:hypothetical protein
MAGLDFEALEMAARRQALRLAARALEQRLNADTSDYVGPELPCPCGGSPLAIMAVTEKPSKAHWELSTSSVLTTTVSNATADSAREIGLWGWNRFR